MSKKKRKKPLSPTHKKKFKEVLELTKFEMSRASYSQDEIQIALDLWDEFILEEQPRIRSANAYASALEYYMAIFLERENTTQDTIAKRYKTTTTSLGRVYRKLIAFAHPKIEREVSEDSFLEGLSSLIPSGLGELEETFLQNPELHQLHQLLQQLTSESNNAHHLQPFILSLPQRRKLQNLPQNTQVWIGDRRTLPTKILDPLPFKPDLAVWFSLENMLALNTTILKPSQGAEAFFESLLDCMLRPNASRPSRPTEIYLPSKELAEMFRDAMASINISVQVGRKEELDPFFKDLNRNAFSRSPQTYLINSHIKKESLRFFFDTTADLWDVAPWNFMNSGQLLQVKIESEEKMDLTLSVTRSSDEQSIGFLIFNSFEDYKKFTVFNGLSALLKEELVAPEMSILSITFQRGADLPVQMRKEVLRNGWTVAEPKAYPTLHASSLDGLSEELTAENYHTAISCSEALALFSSKFKKIFLQENLPKKVNIVHFQSSHLNKPLVQVTAPHPAFFN